MDKRISRIREDMKQDAVRIFKATTPVNTGYQQAHIYAKDTPNGFEVVVNTDYVQYTTDQGPHEGWEKEAAQLFIKKASAKLR